MRIFNYKFLVLLTILTILWGCIFESPHAKRKFQSRTGPFTVTVYPVNVIKWDETEHNKDLAKRIIKFLQDEKLAKGVPADQDAKLKFKRSIIQSHMAANSGNAFIQFVKKQKITTDYALLVDILINRKGRSVKGVHLYLTDKNGLLACFGLTNSKWEEFHTVRPVTKEDGCTVAEMMMKRLWQKQVGN